MRSAIVTLLFAYGCGSEGGSSSSSEPSRAYKDHLAGNAIVDALSVIYGANLVGKPVGPVSASVECPLGGKVGVSGMTEVAASDSRLTLSYALAACVVSGSSPIEGSSETATFRATLEGFVTESGLTAGPLSFKSDSLKFSGYSETNVRVDFDETCPVALTLTTVNGQGKTTGLLCGREVKTTSM